MKGQSEVMIFVLLFAVGLMIFIIALFWSWGIFQQNMDMGKVAAAENFMRKLNDEISSLIKYGGSTSLDYNLDGTVELVSYDSDILCLEGEDGIDGDEYNVSQQGAFGYNPGSNCGPSGHYFIGASTGIYIFKTPPLPQEGDYILVFDYNRGDPGQLEEDFSVGCGGQVYNFPDDAGSKAWRWNSVTCHFNEGVNYFNFTSTGADSVWFDSFRITATISYIIEFKTPINLELPRYWVNLTPTDTSTFNNEYVKGLPSVREMLDGNLFRVQLTYPTREYYSGELKVGELKVELFTEGPRVAKPDIIKVEKNSTYFSDGNDIIVKIKMTFI